MTRFFITLILITFLPVTGCAKKQAAPERAPEEKHTASAPAPQLSPEEMMTKVKEAGTPSEGHKQLAPLIGKFKTISKWWMDPAKDPIVDKGTATSQWVYGKRFVKQDYKGKWGGQPFQGMEFMGYDNVKRAYTSSWIDTMSTAMYISEGKYDPATKSFEMSGNYTCPITGGEKFGRSVIKVINDKQHVVEMYSAGPDGKEFMSMEIDYQRAK